jgi:hypothetical protein
MIMYHPESGSEINVHPTRVDEMTRKGWVTEMPSQAKPKKAKTKAIELEENDNGES